MKQFILMALIAAATLTACDHPPAGTKKQMHKEGADIEVFQYYYNDAGGWVYVARFKDQQEVATTTWIEQHGKQYVKEFSVSKR